MATRAPRLRRAQYSCGPGQGPDCPGRPGMAWTSPSGLLTCDARPKTTPGKGSGSACSHELTPPPAPWRDHEAAQGLGKDESRRGAEAERDARSSQERGREHGPGGCRGLCGQQVARVRPGRPRHAGAPHRQRRARTLGRMSSAATRPAALVRPARPTAGSSFLSSPRSFSTRCRGRDGTA